MRKLGIHSASEVWKTLISGWHPSTPVQGVLPYDGVQGPSRVGRPAQPDGGRQREAALKAAGEIHLVPGVDRGQLDQKLR